MSGNVARGRVLLLIVAALGTIGCDRVTKHAASAYLAGTPDRSFLSDTIRVGYVENTGGFLSLAGGASNWIERVLRGNVVDFLNMGIGPLRTELFNMADVAIMLGAGLFVLGGLDRNHKSGNRRQISLCGSAVAR